MILHVASDIHFEFMNHKAQDAFWKRLTEEAEKDKPDGIIIAGDIGSLANKMLIDNFDKFLTIYKNVYYTPGNHEFFGTGIRSSHEQLKNYASGRPGFHLMLPGMISNVDSIKFTGGTLWYPDVGEDLIKKYWIDYNRIHDSDTEIDVQYKAFLAQEPGDVVISHHFPTGESIAPRWAGSNSNIFFSAFIDKELEAWAQARVLPKLWIHGHTHDPFDYVSKYGFRVYCNPHGYPNEGANTKFFERLRIEIK